MCLKHTELFTIKCCAVRSPPTGVAGGRPGVVAGQLILFLIMLFPWAKMPRYCDLVVAANYFQLVDRLGYPCLAMYQFIEHCILSRRILSLDGRKPRVLPLNEKHSQSRRWCIR